MSTLEERRVRIAERSEERSLSMLKRLRRTVSELVDLDELLDLDRSRLADVVEAGDEEPTDPEVST